MEKAIFGAGCFWGVEAAFAALPGVVATEVGYSGGTTEQPTYEDVCNGHTGHAEVVRVTFDPTKIFYEALVEKFFTLHDPTQVNRQGPDIGDQYRSAIFYTSPEQEKTAKRVRDRLEQSGRYRKSIATVIEPAAPFWRAEEYHQQYIAKRGGGSCRI
ncbi:MAG: peptide-methionine (S)-S-oxide reductase MsrA [Alphaproteobacteria bacterium]|nr:peptide-methionine (S)-S-oxide reductase MsrA [Alphaproteobacteria bacterium]